jgi:hypothetical protein
MQGYTGYIDLIMYSAPFWSSEYEQIVSELMTDDYLIGIWIC